MTESAAGMNPDIHCRVGVKGKFLVRFLKTPANPDPDSKPWMDPRYLKPQWNGQKSKYGCQISGAAALLSCLLPHTLVFSSLRVWVLHSWKLTPFTSLYLKNKQTKKKLHTQTSNTHLLLSELLCITFRGSLSSGKCAVVPHPPLHILSWSGNTVCLDMDSLESGAHTLWQRCFRYGAVWQECNGFSQADFTAILAPTQQVLVSS